MEMCLPKKKLQGPCGAIGCGLPIETRGYCETHYYRLWKFGRLEKINKGRTYHPLYKAWHERKQMNGLCAEWLSFDRFLADVKEKPGPDYFLMRLHDGLYGPDNFKWEAHLRRSLGESKKDWHARKWASRTKAFPGFDRERSLIKKYGITSAQYKEKAVSQGDCCAICGNPETGIDGKTKTLKRLAVDHCHTTGKIRDLLCWRCNQTLGQVKESTDLLKKMIAYLEKHSSGPMSPNSANTVA